MQELVAQVEQAISARKLFREGQPILVAVSGGLDSMVLLHVLHALAPEHRWKLSVAHFNHGLRGAESDGDEQFVAAAARSLGLECCHSRGDVRQFQAQQRLSVEMAARQLRHDFLAHTALRWHIPTIALGHHADDQVELFFLRLLRGASGSGLSGMRWSGPSPSHSNVQLARPLLDRAKSELLVYVQAHGLAYREDCTNATMDHRRNRIRHELLPLLAQNYQPAMAEIILRQMEILGAENEVVTRMAQRWLRQRRRTAFSRLPVAVQRQCLHIELVRHRIEPRFDLIETLRVTPEKASMVAPGVTVRRAESGRLVTVEESAPSPLSGGLSTSEAIAAENRSIAPLCLRVDLSATPSMVDFGALHLEWSVEPNAGSRPGKGLPGRECFDADKVGRTIVLRHWEAGDRFQPIGFRAPIKLQDIFTNQKIPRTERHRLVIATTESGRIFWVEGLRMAEGFKLDKATVNCLKWRWQSPVA